VKAQAARMETPMENELEPLRVLTVNGTSTLNVPGLDNCV